MSNIKAYGAGARWPPRYRNVVCQIKALRRPFAAELIGDMLADDLVEIVVGRESQRSGARRLELVRPAGDDALDMGVGLPADALHRARSGHATEAIHHVADADIDARQIEAAVHAPRRGRQLIG